MGWSTTDWTPGNIQHYADEFWLALNERRKAVVQAEVFVPAAGANVQSGVPSAPTSTTGKFGWRYLQDQIASLCNSFVRSHDDDGTPRSSDYYNGKSTIDMWTFADLMKAVRGGTDQSDFRRATTKPDDWTDWGDPAYSTGKITLGEPRDIFGPWIPADIQKALNLLVWVLHPGSFLNGDDLPFYAGGGIAATWEQAESDAEETYQYRGLSSTGADRAKAAILGSFSSQKEADLWTSPRDESITIPYWGLNRDVDYFCKLEQLSLWLFGEGSTEWSAWDLETIFGNPVQEGVYNLISRKSPAEASGDVVFSAWPSTEKPLPWPATPDPDETILKGFLQNEATKAIARWNVEGGFEYV